MGGVLLGSLVTGAMLTTALALMRLLSTTDSSQQHLASPNLVCAMEKQILLVMGGPVGNGALWTKIRPVATKCLRTTKCIPGLCARGQ